MTDESPEVQPDQLEVQMTPLMEVGKITAKIGDGEGMLFAVEHPAAPNVIAQLYRSVGGEEVSLQPRREVGRIIYAFSRPPQPEEFIVVVIG